jgi:hypothetical protein
MSEMRETLTHGAAWQHVGVSFDAFNFAEHKKSICGRKPHAKGYRPANIPEYLTSLLTYSLIPGVEGEGDSLKLINNIQ